MLVIAESVKTKKIKKTQNKNIASAKSILLDVFIRQDNICSFYQINYIEYLSINCEVKTLYCMK